MQFSTQVCGVLVCVGLRAQAARYSKKGSREAEVGVLAVDALHKQVMPFILRRTKAQVWDGVGWGCGRMTGAWGTEGVPCNLLCNKS